MSTRPATGTGFYSKLVRRPVTLCVVFACLVVIGVISYLKIPLQMMPDGFVEPGLWIVAENPGASAKENEDKVARVLEEQIRTLAGVERIESDSRDNMVDIEVTFNASVEMELAKADMRDRIERARPQLPDTVREVEIFSWNQSDMPVMFFAMLHPGDSPEVDALIDNVIQRQIEAVDGVGQVEIWGVLDDSVRILLEEDKVRGVNLDLGALVGRLANDNFALPLGEVDDGGRRVILRSDMRFKTPEEIARYPIGNGLVIGDVGRVSREKSVRNRLFRIDGSYAYYGEVHKDAQANVVETCHRLHAAFAELEKNPRLEGKFKFLPLFDQGAFIESSLDQLTETALIGGVLAVVILFVFLWRVRVTLAVAISIPISVLLALAWQYLSGGSFNVLTMTGITLAMGMLVDNSIVVIENIVRLRGLGKTGLAAAAQGTREVGLAVTMSTLTSVVVFMPLIFMTENPQLRIIFGELGLPLCTSLLFSLAVALILLPVIAARILGERPKPVRWIARMLAPIAQTPARLLTGFLGACAWIGWQLVRGAFAAARGLLAVLEPARWPLMLGIAALAAWKIVQAQPAIELAEAWARTDGGASAGTSPLVAILVPASVAILLTFFLPAWRRRLAPELSRPQRFVPRSTSVIDLFVDSNQHLIVWSLAHRKLALGLAVLAGLSVMIPSSNMTLAAFGEDEDNSRISIQIELEDNFSLAQAEQELLQYERFFEERKQRLGYEHLANRFDRRGGRVTMYWESSLQPEELEKLQREVLETLPRLPGHRARLRGDDSPNSKNKNQVVFRLEGPDSDELERLAGQAIAILEGVPGLHSVGPAREAESREVRVRFDSDLAQSFDLSPMTAFQNISWALRGASLPRFQEPGREIPLVIEYDDEAIEGLDTLRDMQVLTQTTGIPLTAFADFEYGRSSPDIERVNGQTTYTIIGRTQSPIDQQRLSQAGYEALRANLDLPRGYAIGEEDLASTRAEEEMQELNAALWLSMALVFLLMGILFESFLLPVSVMFTIPFAVVGSFWGLYLTGITMDSVGWIGIIILVGVVVNNGIVLIDRIHQLRHAGVERSAAVIEGCANRVRPVLMTALATVFGLIPIILAAPPSQGIDYRALATCVAGGLVFSTFFTLWVVPLAYTLIDDLAQALGARWRWALRPRTRTPAAAPETTS